VDVVDERSIKTGYTFHLVSGTTLPFSNDSFHVVLSNHVIEHVGEYSHQLGHLRELRRVIVPDGIVYLASPNRWMVIEPHYRLPFLSWTPLAWRTPYLRLMKRGKEYDCNPLSLRQLERMFVEARFAYCNLSIRALREMICIEGKKAILQLPPLRYLILYWTGSLQSTQH